MTRYRSQKGQALVISVLLATSLMGMAALVVDLGSWMRAQRDLQSVADAAALAGAQELPWDTGAAIARANEYVTKNSGPATPQVTILNSRSTNDTVRVRVERAAPGFFARVFSIDSVNVSADASARSWVPSSARWVAPIVVNREHPMLNCNPPPCAGRTRVDLENLHGPGSGDAAGAFALLDLRLRGNGNPGQSTLAEWMQSGYDQFMDLGVYTSAPSVDFNGAAFQNALRDHVGDEVLFPVYQPPITRGGSNARYNIIGWIAFHIEAVEGRGSDGTIHGYFTRYIAEGVQASSASVPDFGVRSIELTE